MSPPDSQDPKGLSKGARRSARDVLGVFGTRVAMFPLTFVVGVLVARALGPSDRGVYAFLGLVSGFLLPFLTFGFGASIIYFISSQRYEARDVTLTCILVGATQGFLSALIVGGLWWFGLAGKTANQTSGWLLLPFLLIQPLNGASLMASRIFLGSSWFGVSNLLSLLSPLLQAILMLVLVIGLHLGLPGAVAVATTTTVLSTGVTILAVWMRYRPRWIWHREFFRKGVAYGFRAWLGDLALRLNLRLDQLVLGVAAPPSALGTYTIAVNIAELLWMIPDSLAVVTFNKLAAEKSESARIRLVAIIHRTLWVIVGGIAVVVGVLGFWMVPLLYGPKFSDAPGYLVLLLPGTLAMLTAKVLTKYFGASGMPGKSSIIQATGAAVSVIGYLIFVPLFGATAAAIVSSVGYAVSSLTAYWLYRKAIQPNPPELLSFRFADFHWLRAQGATAWSKSSHSSTRSP